MLFIGLDSVCVHWEQPQFVMMIIALHLGLPSVSLRRVATPQIQDTLGVMPLRRLDTGTVGYKLP
jgi:hypothetical protein